LGYPAGTGPSGTPYCLPCPLPLQSSSQESAAQFDSSHFLASDGQVYIEPAIVPTLSQWGLIALVLSLLVLMIVTLRRSNQAARTGIVGLLAAALLMGTGTLYARIQVERGCGDTHAAMESVARIESALVGAHSSIPLRERGSVHLDGINSFARAGR
jgi:hypothetical protein